jgi:hypothetical protein
MFVVVNNRRFFSAYFGRSGRWCPNIARVYAKHTKWVAITIGIFSFKIISFDDNDIENDNWRLKYKKKYRNIFF